MGRSKEFKCRFLVAVPCREESRLQVIFAPEYQDYCKEIRRWLPSVKPYSKSEGRKAMWTQVCANHEQLNLYGLIVILAMVFVRIVKFDWYWRLLSK